jgi:predicted Zn-dependent protease
VIAEPRRRALLDAGKLKLSARARLAEGGKGARYEAAVLYHEAARAEHRALLATEAPSPEARLASAIERCACLIEGFDATAVLDDGWADVLAASDAVGREAAAAMRARIDEKMLAFLVRYQRVLAATPGLRSWLEEGRFRPLQAGKGELDRFLKAFPGDAWVWCARSIARAAAGDVSAAWKAIRRARELAPDHTVFVQVELSLVPMYYEPAQAEARLESVYASIERGAANADGCFGFIYGALRLAEKSDRREGLLRQALAAAAEGSRVPPLGPEDRQRFKLLELWLREILAGRKPTVDILYRCGLGHLAATAPEGADPLDLVLSRASPFRRLKAA